MNCAECKTKMVCSKYHVDVIAPQVADSFLNPNKAALIPVDSLSAGWDCTVAVPWQALSFARLSLSLKAAETKDADLLRMVGELKEFEQKLLYSESKPNEQDHLRETETGE